MLFQLIVFNIVIFGGAGDGGLQPLNRLVQHCLYCLGPPIEQPCNTTNPADCIEIDDNGCPCIVIHGICAVKQRSMTAVLTNLFQSLQKQIKPYVRFLLPQTG